MTKNGLRSASSFCQMYIHQTDCKLCILWAIIIEQSAVCLCGSIAVHCARYHGSWKPVCLNSDDWWSPLAVTVMNAAARVVMNLSLLDHVKPALKQLQWLPVEQRIIYKLCLFMHYIHIGQALKYLSDCVSTVSAASGRYRLRSTGSAAYVLPRTRTKFGERGFCSGPAAWNTLPSDLHDITDTSTFRKRLKNVLFDHAYNWLLLALQDESYSSALQISRWLIDWLINWLSLVCVFSPFTIAFIIKIRFAELFTNFRPLLHTHFYRLAFIISLVAFPPGPRFIMCRHIVPLTKTCDNNNSVINCLAYVLRRYCC